ncbi:hypothetical protein THAR02_07028 [Trichoderma harzianum]|uniref:Uncharacterized protein n=1 Tax=Trichoderma harzianum TaxID=5544 RepID=A0A0F9ZKU2_TRIHA|nr:hypothetical protein THAR02_07028 [Trichoderma harzianum]
MEDEPPQAICSCRTCKRDLPEVEFRSVKDPGKFTGQCTSCRARQKERVAESRAAVAGLRNIALRLSPRKATKRTDSLADLTPLRRTAPVSSSVKSISLAATTPVLFRDLVPAFLELPIPRLGPFTPTVVDDPSFAPEPGLLTVVLGIACPTPSLPPQARRRGRYARQSSQPQERQFNQIVDPPFTGDLNLPALSEEDQVLVRQFYTALNDDKMQSCPRCQERWFDMKRNSLNICSRCISRDRKRASDEPCFFSAANHLDFGEVPNNLPNLTMAEEMLIARVHVHVKVLQVRGAQYKYRGHVVHFLRNVGKLFEELPVLPESLDIILLRPPVDDDPLLQPQFARDFRVADTELNALQSRIFNGTPDYESITVLKDMPRSAQAQHQMSLPSIRRTPINEFNHSQPLLSLAFPTLYPEGKADFTEPRLRSITYQEYLAHAMRWQDGRFARHKMWHFVALNTLLRAHVRKRINYFVKQHEGRCQALTRADLEEAMAKPDEPEAQALIQSITRQAAVIRGTRPYWKINPILPVTRDFLVGNETCARTQFPLIVAFAITVHKCQSLTKDRIVTDLSTRDFQAGISYVAVSRVTSLQGLLLEAPFDRQSLYNHTPTEGMKMRLVDQQRRQAQQLTNPPYPPAYLD